MIGFSDYLQEQLNKCYLKNNDVAQSLGVTTSTVSQWLNGLKQPSIENLINLSNLFGVSLDDLLKHKFSDTAKMNYKYNFMSLYFNKERQLDLKKLNTKEKKLDLINKYKIGVIELTRIIKEYFTVKDYENILLQSFIQMYDIKYKGEPLTFKIVNELKDEMTYYEFFKDMEYGFDLDDYIVKILDNNDLNIFIDYLKEIKDINRFNKLFAIASSEKNKEAFAYILGLHIDVYKDNNDEGFKFIRKFIYKEEQESINKLCSYLTEKTKGMKIKYEDYKLNYLLNDFNFPEDSIEYLFALYAFSSQNGNRLENAINMRTYPDWVNYKTNVRKRNLLDSLFCSFNIRYFINNYCLNNTMGSISKKVYDLGLKNELTEFDAKENKYVKVSEDMYNWDKDLVGKYFMGLYNVALYLKDKTKNEVVEHYKKLYDSVDGISNKVKVIYEDFVKNKFYGFTIDTICGFLLELDPYFKDLCRPNKNVNNIIDSKMLENVEFPCVNGTKDEYYYLNSFEKVLKIMKNNKINITGYELDKMCYLIQN